MTNSELLQMIENIAVYSEAAGAASEDGEFERNQHHSLMFKARAADLLAIIKEELTKKGGRRP